MSTHRWARGRLLGWLLIGSVLVAAGGEPVPAIKVYTGFDQRLSAKAKIEYVNAFAGKTVAGSGRVEVVVPRSFYETLIPEANPVAALVQVGPGRKAVCGLPAQPSPEELGRLHEGAAVIFSGQLGDARDWGEWTTLYLGDCEVTRR